MEDQTEAKVEVFSWEEDAVDRVLHHFSSLKLEKEGFRVRIVFMGIHSANGHVADVYISRPFKQPSSP